jgi:hypothetical protein
MVWREWCRSEAYERVVRIQTSRGRGAAFTIDRNGRQWLITARHLLPAGEPAPECALSRGAFRTTLRLGFLADPGGEGDVAVAPLQSPFTPQLELHATSEGLMWSQIVYFLGFPYGMATDVGTPGQEIAFVKQAIVSASRRISDALSVWYLDGYNNPGFSGGPVVASTEKFQTMQVIGIVFGNRSFERPLEIEKKEMRDAIVRENTGIIMATDIRYATLLIDAAT